MYIIRYKGQNDKVLLKIFKLLRMIPKKKKSLISFKNFGGAKAPLGPCDGLPLLAGSVNNAWDPHKKGNCHHECKHIAIQTITLKKKAFWKTQVP